MTEQPTNTQQNIILVILILIFNIPESPVTTEKCDDMNGNITDDVEKEDLQVLQICESVLKGYKAIFVLEYFLVEKYFITRS